MNLKKLFIWMSIIGAIIAIIAIALLYFDSENIEAKCGDGASYDSQNQQCYFQAQSCPVNITIQNKTTIPITSAIPLPENGYNCIFIPKSVFDNKAFVYTLYGIGALWILSLIFFIIEVVQKNEKQAEIGEFRKEDFVDADRARKLWALAFARENNIPIYGEDSYQKSVFNYMGKQNIFQKGQEWFVRFMCEVTAGRNPGLYTVIISMSRGEKWILAGNQNWEECHHEEYKFSRTMPLHTPQNQQERILQQLWEVNPEKALELQKRMLEEGAANQQPTPVAPDVLPQNPEGFGGYPPQQRRPYYRRPFYRRGY